jgi:hypothetical protein
MATKQKAASAKKDDHDHDDRRDHDDDHDHDDDRDSGSPSGGGKVLSAKERRQQEFDRMAAEIRSRKKGDHGHSHGQGGHAEEEEESPKKKKKSKSKPTQYNWTAIGFLALMMVPAIISLAMSVGGQLRARPPNRWHFGRRELRCFGR